jgi:vacuolar-type H+-ATPase subunit F/Vma7
MTFTPEHKNKQPLVIFGAEDVILGFRALGFRICPVKDAVEFNAILPEIIAQGAVVCLVEDNLYRAAASEIAMYRNLYVPIFLPFSRESQSDSLDSLTKEIRLRATGAV